MNYAKLFFLTFFTIFAVQAKTSIKYSKHVHQAIESWLHEYFSNKLYENLTYTEEVFMDIKQHLFDKNYKEEIPHKDLKKIVKNNIKDLKQKKYRSRHWFLKNKKGLTKVIKNYFKKHNTQNKWGIYQYLNTNSNKVCRKLQETMHRDDILPVVLNKNIKSLIKQLQPHKN